MIFRVTFKDPNALWAAEQNCEDDFEMDEIKKAFEKWFEYDEYVELEIDTEKDTCVVVKPNSD